MANAGRVAIVPKGEYNSATAYKRLDLVRYNNAVYVARKANTGVSPTKTDTWMLCIQNVTQEQYDDLISGAVQVESAKEADNALKLESLTAKQVGESGVRNLIMFPYYRPNGYISNGVTYTYGNDGIVYANGIVVNATSYFALNGNFIPTYSGTVTLSLDTGGSNLASVYFRHDDINGANLGEYAIRQKDGSLTFDMWEDDYASCTIGLYFAVGTVLENLPIKVQVENGSISHDYVPYHNGGAEDSITVNGLTTKQIGNSGARNILPFPYWSKSNTNAGITWTVNDDGTITANGTATASSFFNLLYRSSKTVLVPAGTEVTLNCGFDKTSVSMAFMDSNDETITKYNDIGNGVTAIVPEGTEAFYLYIYVAKGTVLNNTIIKPMLEMGTVAHDYVPYHFGGAANAKTLMGILPEGFYQTDPIDLDGTIVDCFSLIPGHYNFKAVSTDMNFPVTDSTTLEATLIITGSYSVASAKGYRKYYYHDNKGRRYYANEWWGNTPVWNGNADGGNAATLDGKHASDFLLTTGGTATGVLGTNKRFARHVTNYEKGTVPSSSLWNDGVTIFDKNGAVLGGVQQTVYTNGSSTLRLIAEQLVDGVSKDAVLTVDITADGKAFATAPTPPDPQDNDIKIATTAWVNKFMLAIIGNSSAVIQSTSAPSDTSAVWVDTANKVTKIYKDGAWTALA